MMSIAVSDAHRTFVLPPPVATSSSVTDPPLVSDVASFSSSPAVVASPSIALAFASHFPPPSSLGFAPMCVIASRFKSSLRVDAYRILVRRAVVAVWPSSRRPSVRLVPSRDANRRIGASAHRAIAGSRDRRIGDRAIDRPSIARSRRSIDRRSTSVDRVDRRSSRPARRSSRPHNDVVRVGDVCARDDGRARRVDGARAREDVGDDDGRARDDRARRRGAAKRARDGRGRAPRWRVSSRDGDDGRMGASARDARRGTRGQSGDDARGGGRGGGAGGRR
jgi:hypothetical protein